MAGIIGKKLGMSSFFSEDGKSIPCTMIEAGPCVVTQIKDIDKDGYNAIQLGFADKKAIKVNNSEKGHANKANTVAKKVYVEFSDNFSQTDSESGAVSKLDLKLGDVVNGYALVGIGDQCNTFKPHQERRIYRPHRTTRSKTNIRRAF